MRFLLALVGGCLLLTGCGAAPNPQCNYTQVLTVAPTVATADHSAPSPGNQVQFVAGSSESSSGGCPVPTLIARVFPTWTNPDPLNISISSASDQTNGTAVCSGMTAGVVTLTATLGTGTSAQTKTAALTCN